MTSKEALEKIGNYPIGKFGIFTIYDLFKEDFDLITQSLERLEMLEKENIRKSGVICMLESELEELHKDYNNKDLECIDLYKENQELLIALENKIKEIGNLKKLIHDNPYKKAIEILKESLDLEFVNANKETAKDLELLNWVLENEK